MLDTFVIDKLGIFILYNFLTIFVISVIYFFTKEFYRVKGNNPSRTGRAVVGAGLGIATLLTFLLLNYIPELDGWMHLIPKDWGPNLDGDYGTIYPTVMLTPAILYLIILPIMIDKRLVIPIAIFILFGYLIKLPIEDPSFFDEPATWSILPMALFSTAVFALIIYFFDKTNLFKNNGVKVMILLLIWLLITLLLRLIQATIILENNLENMKPVIMYEAKLWGIEIAYLLSFVLVQALPIFLIEKAYDNFNKLETFSTQDDVSYYKISLAQNKLINLIDQNKINTGAIILLDFEMGGRDFISQILSDIKSRVEWDYDGAFFFKATSIYYGIFIPLENINISSLMENNKNNSRTKEDVLFKLEETIKSVEDTYKVNIYAAASIYGVHSYDIPELVEYSRFLLTPVVRRSNSNSIIVYDFKRVKSRLTERNNVMNLPIDINSLNISYLKGINEEFIYYPLISFVIDGQKYNLTNINDAKLTKQTVEFIIRYSSYQSLRGFNIRKSSLVVYYPSSYLSSQEFVIGDMEKKINRYLPNKNVIIGLYMNGEKNKKVLKNNIEELRNLGFRFAIINPLEINQEKHDLVKPEFLIDLQEQLNPLKITKKKLEIKSDATRLNSNLV